MSPLRLLLAATSLLPPVASAIRLIESNSLNPCMENSKFSATLFNVIFTPDNNTLTFDVVGVSDISSNVTADLAVFAYGYQALRRPLNPCDNPDLAGLCPMNTGNINIESNFVLGSDVVKQVPGIAYTIPDLDGKVQIRINETGTGKLLACVEAELSNGKTVDQKAVGWVTAVIAGIGLVASAITSGLGHSNTAAHVAANALSLFGYFQSQAFIGMTAVELPPIVASWTQNFQWTMGIIRVGFLQKMCTWYQRATGGTPSKLLSSLATVSVEVQKRSIEMTERIVRRAYHSLLKRINNQTTNAETTQVVAVHGIERVGFRAGIEITNIFLTGYSFFVIFVIFVTLGVIIFKLILEGLVRGGKMKGEKFQDFRNGWKTVLKGILFRVVLIGLPQMVVLCFWELTKRDSSAEVVLAIFTVMTMILILAWAASKVIRLARRSIAMHKNPAYILYSDPVSLNKWGFLYVQFKATAYYFIVPLLLYTLVKGMFIGLGQKSGTTQAIALVIIEAALLIAVSIMRPYMDKKTNAFNISIAAVNFVSAIFLLVFSNIFNQPGIVTGVMGVIFFIFNAAFALILLLMVLVSSIYALASKNPDTRYQPMRDDRGSFIKSQTQLTTELDALGATARGEQKGQGFYSDKPRSRIEDDDDSFSSSSVERGAAMHSKGVETPGSMMSAGYPRDPPRSPVDPSIPLYPSNKMEGRHGPPGGGYYGPRSSTSSPAPPRGYGYDGGSPFRPTITRSSTGNTGFRTQNNASPWQRGAGYDH